MVPMIFAAGVMASAVAPSIEWARGYPFGHSESHPHAGVELADGGFLMVGDGVDYTHANPAVKRYWFAQRVDRNGTLLWQAVFGTVGFNYGKFGIELPDGTIVLAGALSIDIPLHGAVLHRALLRLSTTGKLMHQLVLPNNAPATHLRDGFMCVTLADTSKSQLVAVGFVGGENSSAPGYIDEPMFLIERGSAFVAKVAYSDSGMHLEYSAVIPAPAAFQIYQAMRVVYDHDQQQYIVSHTITYNDGNNLQMGLTAIGLDGNIKWTRGFPAEHGVGYSGHASHPYALALARGGTGSYAIGGHAVLSDPQGIDRCQGRIISVTASGELAWDSRFASLQKDTNIECYGIQATHDGGYIMTCGTGVEPELHPHDSPKLKTWMVLVIRVDSKGNKLYQQNYTSNEELKSNAGEYIVALKDGRYAIYIDSKGTFGPPETGGNFALMMLSRDT